MSSKVLLINGREWEKVSSAAAVLASDEIIHKCILCPLYSCVSCHKVFHACLRFIQEHIGYLIPSLIICIQGTCRREPSISRTFQNNTINNTQCCWQTPIADPNKAACVFGKVWRWFAGGGSASPCSNHRFCPTSVAVKDLSSDNKVNNIIIKWRFPSLRYSYSVFFEFA